MITEMKAGHLKDIDKPSEPFEVIGKIIPRYENENWTLSLIHIFRPLSGEKPSQLQKKPSILQTMREQNEKVKAEPPKEAPAKNAER